jgi:hypothetical protein
VRSSEVKSSHDGKIGADSKKAERELVLSMPPNLVREPLQTSQATIGYQWSQFIIISGFKMYKQKTPWQRMYFANSSENKHAYETSSFPPMIHQWTAGKWPGM